MQLTHQALPEAESHAAVTETILCDFRPLLGDLIDVITIFRTLCRHL